MTDNTSTPVSPSSPESPALHEIAVHVSDDRHQLGEAAGLRAAQLLRERLWQHGRARVCLAAAPSQSATLATLAAADGVDGLELSRVDFFHMDDYLGLGPDAPQGFGRWLLTNFFDRLGPSVRAGFRRIDVTESPDRAAADYARTMGTRPFDLLLCGLGVNAHLAFNDPGCDLADPESVRVIELAETSRRQQLDEGHFPTLEDVPTTAITVTIPRLLNADHVICSVPGAEKRRAVTDTLALDPTTDVPGTALKRHPDVHLYVDRDAAPRD